MRYTLFFLLCIFLVISSRLQAQIINSYAGNGIIGYTGNGGPATSATLNLATCLAVDGSGNIYFTDQNNYCVRKVTTSGIITTIAGTGSSGFGGDGGPATAAQMSDCWGVAVDGSGNIYITDQEYYRVRKVNTSGIINTIAGNGTDGVGGDNGPAISAQLKRPIGIALDGPGNLYVGDQDAFTIKKINLSNIITTFAGIDTFPGFSGNGVPATNATFEATFGLATDYAGNVYISDAQNNCIRKVNTSGIINTVAGNGTAGFGGDGGAATACYLNHPTGIFVDGAGSLYIADCFNHRIRRVNTAGIIRTIAGTGTPGFTGDGGLCTTAELNYPTTVVVDSSHNIYLADYGNDRIRKITMELFFTYGRKLNLALCENSLLVSLDSLLTFSDGAIGLKDSINFLTPPGNGTAHVAYTATATGADVIPSGLYYSPQTGYSGDDSLTVVVTNGIASDTTTIYITVVPIIQTAGIITGDSSVCAGSSIKLSDSIAAGIWTISNLNAIVTEGLVTGESAGRDTVMYTVSNMCGTESTTKIITINPLPNAGIISGADELCVGASITLSDTITGGHWSASNTSVAIDFSGTSCVVTAISPGAVTIFYSISDSLCSAIALKALTIETFPTAAITGDTGLCIGSTLTLDGIPAGGDWGLSNQSASFVPDFGGIILTGITAGMDRISYTVTNFCGTAVTSDPFAIDSLPAKPVITRNEGTIYAPAGYAGYQWTLNGTNIPGATGDTFALNNTGYYAVTVTNSYGCTISSDSIDFPGCTPDDIIFFPNPTESIIYFNWCKKVTARLMCIDGKQVKTITNTNEIDLGDLPNGVYLLVLYENGIKIKAKCITKLTR